jgi:PAS domain S-box-containing protein
MMGLVAAGFVLSNPLLRADSATLLAGLGLTLTFVVLGWLQIEKPERSELFVVGAVALEALALIPFVYQGVSVAGPHVLGLLILVVLDGGVNAGFSGALTTWAISGIGYSFSAWLHGDEARPPITPTGAVVRLSTTLIVGFLVAVLFSQMSRARSRYQELIDSLGALVWEADRETRSFSFVNDSGTRAFGYSAESWIERFPEWGTHIMDADAEQAVKELLEVPPGETRRIEYRVWSGHGTQIDVQDLVHCIRRRSRNRSRGVILDVSVIKQAAADLDRALQIEAEAARQLRSVEKTRQRFLSSVAHDLRNPLSAILALVGLFQKHGFDLSEKRAQAALGTMGDASRRLDASLEDLLEIEKLFQGRAEIIRTETNLREMIERLATASPLADQLKLELDDVTVPVDARRAERMIEHLLDIAARRSGSGNVLITLTENEEGAAISVEDSGPALKISGSAESFDPFESIDSDGPAPGIGISLFLVSRFAQAHGGRAWAEGTDDGAVFKVLLPR